MSIYLSNLTISLQFPSVYSKTRRRALEHTLDKFHNDKYPNAPYFLFGDFNFRTDTSNVIKVRLGQQDLLGIIIFIYLFREII